MNAHTPPARKDHIDALGASLLIGFSALMGCNQVIMKLVNQGMNPVFQAGLRSVAAAVPVLLFVWWRGAKVPLRGGVLIPGIVTGLFFALEFLLIFKALDFTSVTRSSVLFYTMPIWVAFGAHFLIPGERLTHRRMGGLVLACIGVAVALAHNARPASDLAFIGDLMAIGAAVCWASIALITRVSEFSRAAAPVQLLYQLAVSAPVLLVLSPLFGPTFREMTPALWGIFSIQAIGVVAIGYMVWFWVLSIYPASDMSSFAFLTPLFGVTFGWLILGEPLTANIVAALALVGIGIWLVNRKPKSGPG
ncbi:MAG: DMT family transporter [Nitratireductor sp.]|nr:DMT family transporter [Nitratireductor sp.]